MLAVNQILRAGSEVSRSSQLRDIDIIKWAEERSGLKEMRDIREIQTLAGVLSRLNAGRLPEAADFIAQRIKAVITAKQPKGSWEKAQTIELLTPTTASVVNQSEIALTGLGT